MNTLRSGELINHINQYVFMNVADCMLERVLKCMNKLFYSMKLNKHAFNLFDENKHAFNLQSDIFICTLYESPAKSSVTNRLPKFYPRYILKCFTALELCVE